MKKRLFISSILMTLVLLVAITTATFAWYSAASGNGGTVKESTGSGTISAADPNYEVASVALPLAVAVERVDAGAAGSKNLELGEWFDLGELAGKKNVAGTAYTDSSAAGLYHAFINRNGEVRYQLGQFDSTNLVPVAVYKITLKAQAADYTDPNGTTWTNAQIADALKGQNITISITQNSSRAMFFNVTPGDTRTMYTINATDVAAAVSTPSEGATSLDIEAALSATAADLLTAGNGTSVWFALYVNGSNLDGESHEVTETATPTGNFSISVTAR